MKINTCAIVTICDCHILFAFYNVGKVSYNWTGVQRIKDFRLYAKFHQYGRCGNFMLLFCKGQQGLVH